MQDYKCLCVVVMICTSLVNTQTHTHRHADRRLLLGYTIASASELKTVAVTSLEKM